MACRIEVLNGDDSQARSQVRHAMGCRMVAGGSDQAVQDIQDPAGCKLFDGEVRSAGEDGETVDPRGGKTELHVVYKSWLASGPDPSPKARSGYEDNWRLRIEPIRFRRRRSGREAPMDRKAREAVADWKGDHRVALPRDRT
jgi:hypothetical protein